MTAGSAKLPLSLSDRFAVGFGSTFVDCNRWLGKVGLPYLFRWELPVVLTESGPPTPTDTDRDSLSLSVPAVSDRCLRRCIHGLKAVVLAPAEHLAIKLSILVILYENCVKYGNK
jgi:hypothetical protein